MFDLARRRTLAVPLSLLVFTSGCRGNETNPSDTAAASEQHAAPPALVPAGTRLTFRLTQTLSTADARAGGTFDAVVTTDVVGSGGRIMVSAGAPVRGKVLESREGHDRMPAILALEFEEMKVSGEWMPIDATVVSAEARGAEAGAGRGSTSRIAIGAEAASLIDELVGRDTLSVSGSTGVGPFVGAVVALTIDGPDASLRDGSRFRVRLNVPVDPE